MDDSWTSRGDATDNQISDLICPESSGNGSSKKREEKESGSLSTVVVAL